MVAKGKRKALTPLQIEINESDFKEYLAEMEGQPKTEELKIAASITDWIRRKPKDQEAPEGTEDAVIKLLPKVIARKIAERVPTGFYLSKITFNGEISGAPFGVGVKGGVEIEFEREKKG